MIGLKWIVLVGIAFVFPTAGCQVLYPPKVYQVYGKVSLSHIMGCPDNVDPCLHCSSWVNWSQLATENNREIVEVDLPEGETTLLLLLSEPAENNVYHGSTADGTLKAWLVRIPYSAAEVDGKVRPAIRDSRFLLLKLALTGDVANSELDAYPLRGTIVIKPAPHGTDGRDYFLDLRMAAPLPVYHNYMDRRPNAEKSESTEPTTMPAEIKGKLEGRLVPVPFD